MTGGRSYEHSDPSLPYQGRSTDRSPGIQESSRSVTDLARRFHRSSSTPPDDSRTPLTPEESPPVALDRRRAGEALTHCLCQKGGKIARPRNAFILYRQFHQAEVVAQNPGLANPDISKIIGQLWQDESVDSKNAWKQSADREKALHKLKFPEYRYKPRRKGRRDSPSDSNTGIDKDGNCQVCGGSKVSSATTPASYSRQEAGYQNSHLTSPISTATPEKRRLPSVADYNSQSPFHHPDMARHTSSPVAVDRPDDYNFGRHTTYMGQDHKRRRYNHDHPQAYGGNEVVRHVAYPQGVQYPPSAQYRYGTQAPMGPPLYAPIAPPPPRQESLPGLRGMINAPAPMPALQPPQQPPPHPHPGPPQARPMTDYGHHHASQVYPPPDRSLTLPPINDVAAAAGKSVREIILDMDISYRLSILQRVAPPQVSKKALPRGPLITIEGDSTEAVAELKILLKDVLNASEDLTVLEVPGPVVIAKGCKEEIMSGYYRLIADWLTKSVDIMDSLAIKTESFADHATNNSDNESHPTDPIKRGDDDLSEKSRKAPGRSLHGIEKMLISQPPEQPPASRSPTTTNLACKQVGLITNFALYTSTWYACNIPLLTDDPYTPHDHWRWAATLWRGVVSPDLTIYVRDENSPNASKAAVEEVKEFNMFVVRRSKVDGRDVFEMDASVLRRLGFEVCEWVREFGKKALQRDK